jgi:hypothetical protein
VSPAVDVQLSLVFVSGNWVEAEMVACTLEGHKIPTLLVDDHVCRIMPQASLVVGGVKVLVRLGQLSEASDLLQAIYGGAPPFIGGFLTMPLSLPAALIMKLRQSGRGGS